MLLFIKMHNVYPSNPRALATVKLNSYIAILASLKYKNCSTIVKA